MEQMAKGFERLYETMDDLVKDVPLGRGLAAKFTARAVADEVLPPAFLRDPIVVALAGDIAEQAKVRQRRTAALFCWQLVSGAAAAAAGAGRRRAGQ
jgi:hypothetical protein